VPTISYKEFKGLRVEGIKRKRIGWKRFRLNYPRER
jgi:hypothetical protein